jgi:hypothetical protein
VSGARHAVGRRPVIAAVVGAGVIATYLVLAAVSGHLSPLARRPALDGLGPLTPYRWVAPPPEVQDNRPPTPGTFVVPVRGGRTDPDLKMTEDVQVSLLLDRGVVTTDDPRVRFDVTPLDPTTLGPLPGELATFGNAIRIDATEEPSGRSPAAFEDLVAILVYPETVSLHSAEHEILYSPNGQRWRALDTRDTLATSQVQAEMPGPGYLVVGGVPRVIIPVTPRPPGAGDGNTGTLATALLVVSIASLVVGIAFLLRARRAPADTGRG